MTMNPNPFETIRNALCGTPPAPTSDERADRYAEALTEIRKLFARPLVDGKRVQEIIDDVLPYGRITKS